MASKHKIGYFGRRMSFTHTAAISLFPNEELIGYNTHRECFRALGNGEVDIAVLPVENSSSGPMTETLQLLVEQTHNVPIKIVGEYYKEINHCVLVRDETVRIESIEAILTISIAKDQCELWVDKNLSSAEFVPVASTAEAGSQLKKWIKTNRKEAAAIASEDVAKEYDLHILARRIQDLGNNTTRFLILSKNAGAQEHGDQKVTFAVVLHDRPGSLGNTLNIISSKKINIISLKMTPVRAPAMHDWKDWFLFDIPITDKTREKGKEIFIQFEESDDVLIFKALGIYSDRRPSKRALVDAIFGDSPHDLTITDIPHLGLSQIIAKQESNSIEFKSSLRWNYKENNIRPELGVAIAITASAMMNTDGGVILIGVDNSGFIIGLEPDFKIASTRNEDKFQLTLVEILANCIGKVNAVHIKIDFEEKYGKKVCILRIPKGNSPVYARFGGKKEFYVRIGSSNRPLDMEEANKYINRK